MTIRNLIFQSGDDKLKKISIFEGTRRRTDEVRRRISDGGVLSDESEDHGKKVPPGIPGSGLICLSVLPAQIGVPTDAVGLTNGRSS